jgi:hypothetical protein
MGTVKSTSGIATSVCVRREGQVREVTPPRSARRLLIRVNVLDVRKLKEAENFLLLVGDVARRQRWLCQRWRRIGRSLSRATFLYGF